ncbi:MAG TPA: DNA topoisomerase, partial [Patescibacteria group bacterium]
SLAQKLYEEGYITYHRTDSVNLSQAAITATRGFVEKNYGREYIPESPRFYSAKQKLAQEAHEAIRPTKVQVDSDRVAGDLGKDFARLYDMIWKRAVASQMSDAKIESTTVLVETGNGRESSVESRQSGLTTSDQRPATNTYTLKTTGSILVFDGFLKVNPFGLEDRKVPDFSVGEILDIQKALAERHDTTPPPRYNDASLIKSLEEAGIGRPSTYATIIGTIEARQYIEREMKKFVPTSVGMAVNDFLVKHFSDVDDIPFTADMENNLDEVANGEKKWEPMIGEFYKPFEKKLEVVKKADRIEIPAEETGEKCPKDGAPLVIRVGRFGKFISCKNFPTCDFKKQYVEETAYTCPKDGGRVIVKKTKKGRPFYGCSNYPNCDFAVWKLDDLKKQSDKNKTDSGKKENK